MKLDLSGAEVFLAYAQGEAPIGEVFRHPAYAAIREHSRRYGREITPEDIEADLRGEPSPFYGLSGLRENSRDIRELIYTLHERGEQWASTASRALLRLAPHHYQGDITVYPVIGYDMGIGVGDWVCMNLNWRPYLDDPEEFIYFMIHETFHVVYERVHSIPSLDEVETPEQWLSYLKLWTQNEGLATYAPLALRLERGHLGDVFHDYEALADVEQIRACVATYKETLALFERDEALPGDEYMERVFGSQRLTYRVGCEIARSIEAEHGLGAVQEAVYLDGDEFVGRYLHLLERLPMHK